MTVELSQDDYGRLIHALGYAAGVATKYDAPLMQDFLRLADRVRATVKQPPSPADPQTAPPPPAAS